MHNRKCISIKKYLPTDAESFSLFEQVTKTMHLPIKMQIYNIHSQKPKFI